MWKNRMRTESKELLAVGILGGRSGLGDRIELLVQRGRSFSPRTSLAGVAASTAFLGALTLLCSIAPRLVAFAEEPERLSFEVASVKPANRCEGDQQDEKFSPGRVSVTCITPANLIQAAYGRFGNGAHASPKHLLILGAPEWVRSSRYDIAAKARANAPMGQMFGPMLQVLLEDRFRLKVHIETRELPVYTLKVTKSGPRLSATKESSCIPVDLKHGNDLSPNFCGMTGRANGLHVTDDARGMTMPEIAGRMLANRLDRPVIDQTGLAGLFDAHLEFDRASTTGDPADGAERPSIFTAVQEQLGLKLSPDKGPVEVLVVDHVEKPDAN
jgi:uncharacterized protein (TIGR03435 family)